MADDESLRAHSGVKGVKGGSGFPSCNNNECAKKDCFL